MDEEEELVLTMDAIAVRVGDDVHMTIKSALGCSRHVWPIALIAAMADMELRQFLAEIHYIAIHKAQEVDPNQRAN